MTDLLRIFELGLSTFGARVHAVAPQQWDGPTPATRWTVADLVDHLVDEHSWADRTVALSIGPTAAPDYAAEMVLDLAVHSSDLGRAIGAADPLPDELVSAALRQVDSYGGGLSGSSGFAEPVPVPTDASAEDTLVARTGCDPHWTRAGRD